MVAVASSQVESTSSRVRIGPFVASQSAPVRELVAEVEVHADLQLRRDRVERVRVAGVQRSGRERQHRVADGAELAGDVERGLQARALRLDERGRARVEGVGLLGGHPLEARREQLALAIRPALTKCQRSTPSALRPADARAGRALVVDPPPGRAQVLRRRDRRRGRVVAAAPPIPASKDLRATWWKIGDQGSTGSCVGWATADSVLRWHFVKAGRLARHRPLSPRFVGWPRRRPTRSSTRPTTFIETRGHEPEGGARRRAQVRRGARLGARRSRRASSTPARRRRSTRSPPQLKILAYFNLGHETSTNWRRWLATKGPILTRLDVDGTWDEAPATKGNLDVYKPDTARGGHAVAIVGYTPGRFIVRNSWGTSWGDKGFGYASLAYAQDGVHRGVRHRGLSATAGSGAIPAGLGSGGAARAPTVERAPRHERGKLDDLEQVDDVDRERERRRAQARRRRTSPTGARRRLRGRGRSASRARPPRACRTRPTSSAPRAAARSRCRRSGGAGARSAA